MDFATLAVSGLLAIGLLGGKTASHTNSGIVEVTALPKSDRLLIDQTTLEQEYVALFRNDVKGAGALFEKAVAEYPSGPVAKLNTAFADLESDNDQKAVERMATLISQSPPDNQ